MAQVGQRNLNWTDECEQSFKQIKAILAKEAFLQYPDHNKPFHIYADASDKQLGSVILQDGKPRG
jgi:RNase H-like domain found in reverse transcriptase